MTSTAKTYTQGFAAGSANREDLSDVITNVDPTDTPFFTMVQKGKAYHTTHEWLQDVLTSLATNQHNEGSVFSATATKARTRVVNVTEIFRKDLEVSNTMLAVNPAGVADELSYQVEKALAELGVLIEKRCLATAGSSATGADGTKRHMKSLQDFITTNKWHCDSTAVGGAGAVASSHTLLETQFNGALEATFNSGGKPRTILVPAKTKRQISTNFSGASGFSHQLNQTIDGMDPRLVNAVDVYLSDFGQLRFVLDRHVPVGTTATATLTGVIFGLEMENISFDWLRPMAVEGQPPDGDVRRAMVVGEGTTKVANEKAHFIMSGVKGVISAA